MCTFCTEEVETLIHMFIRCPKLKNYWERIHNTLLRPFGIKDISETDILLGVIDTDKINNVVNHIILEAKWCIYTSKLEKTMPTYNQLRNKLKLTESIEQDIARRNGKTKTHNYKWNDVVNHLLAD